MHVSPTPCLQHGLDNHLNGLEFSQLDYERDFYQRQFAILRVLAELALEIEQLIDLLLTCASTFGMGEIHGDTNDPPERPDIFAGDRPMQLLRLNQKFVEGWLRRYADGPQATICTLVGWVGL